MADYAGDAKTLIADVDCTAEGKPLCDANGVKGFPTIKHGDPSALEDYQGGRDLASLTKFAEGLKPMCSPAALELCDDEQKAKIETVQAMTEEELDAAIAAADKLAADAEETFKTEVDKLQATYKQLSDDKEATLEEVKESGVGLLKSVKAAKAKAATATHDEL